MGKIENETDPQPDISENSNTKKLMTVGDVARRLNCSVTNVYRQNDLGLMPPCIRMGRLVRWEAEDIEELIRKKKQESAENIKNSKKMNKVVV